MFLRSAPCPPPENLHIETIKVCNSRCKTCFIWAEREEPNRLATVERRVEIVEEFAELNPQGRVYLCGGETLLAPERLFPLTRRCRALGLWSKMATNGSLIDDAMAERLVLEGPSQIALSLNSHRGELHDDTRGRPGSFAEVLQAVRRLQGARARHGGSTRIHVYAIIFEKNYRELEELHHFALTDLGVDRVDLGFLQPTFHRPAALPHDRFFAENVVADGEALAAVLARCDERFGLGLNPAWIDQAVMYHRSIRQRGEALRGWADPHGTAEHICATYERNIVVDPTGMARLCFSHAFRGRQLRRRGDLGHFWRTAGDIRRKMQDCRCHCGIVDPFSRHRVTLQALSSAGVC